MKRLNFPGKALDLTKRSKKGLGGEIKFEGRDDEMAFGRGHREIRKQKSKISCALRGYQHILSRIIRKSTNWTFDNSWISEGASYGLETKYYTTRFGIR